MKTNKDNKTRQTIDGFTLNHDTNNNLEKRYITTDQGVYSQPDDNYKTSNKEKNKL
jgi:hypothetical protein